MILKDQSREDEIISDGFNGRPMSSRRLAPAQKAPGPYLKKKIIISSNHYNFFCTTTLNPFLVNYLFVFPKKKTKKKQAPRNVCRVGLFP